MSAFDPLLTLGLVGRVQSMSEHYQCCFCGETINRADDDAVHLIAQNLWKRDPDIAQAVYAHSSCAAEHMAAGEMTPTALHDEANYSVQEIVWGENEGERGRISLWTCLALLLAVIGGAYLLIR